MTTICLLSLLGLVLPAQNVAFYIDQMNTDPAVDPTVNARIDSIWSDTERGAIDSVTYPEAVRYLQGYYDGKTNEITSDKAELYAYFLLLRFKDYPAIIDRFENRTGQYNHRAFTTIGEIYRRAFMRQEGTGLTDYQTHLDSLSRLEDSEEFTKFLVAALDLQPGQPAPAFEIRDSEGRVYHSDSLIGKVVVLDFWATWCTPCIAEIPEIRRMHEKYADRSDFVLISVSRDTDVERWKDFLARNQLDWPQAIDTPRDGARIGDMVEAYRARGVPKYILIDREGYVRYNSHLAELRFIPDSLVDRYL
jgi:thiol-disulfide isomerase/thioredoxin